jgi:polyketide synthase PksN
MSAVAVIGMACRFPGAATYQAFWDNLTSGRCAVRPIPESRWDPERYYAPDAAQPGRSVSRWCGLLDDVDRFDNTFFGVSPREATKMDPQQRLVLEETWHCLEDAGVRLDQVRRARTGVFAGVMAIDYHQNATGRIEEVDAYSGSGSYGCMLANRVSYFLGLRGASYTVDAACASSLVALHAARQALLLGECDYALVAAASLDINPWKYVSFSKAHMLSPQGRCKTFDARADGYVPGEGVAVLLLRRHADARDDHNRVHGLVTGSAVNHNGRTPSLTAPSIPAQVEVIRGAQRAAGVDASEIQYVEAHGTGTSLGDPIEVAALARAFGAPAKGALACRLGSVKTNLGHLEAAAGLAGLAKVLLMMKHGAFVPTLGVEEPNPLIDLEASPFALCLERGDWPRPDAAPRRAGVSSFGFGGANAHVVVEEAVAPEPAAASAEAPDGLPFTLSARSPGALTALLERWRAHVRAGGLRDVRLVDVCKTLVLGREPMPFRCGAVVRSKEELADWLDRGAQAPDQPAGARPGVWFGGADDAPAAAEQRAAAEALIAAGLSPAVVGGSRDGLLSALVVAGALPAADADAWAGGARAPVVLRRPRYPLFDSVAGRAIPPVRFRRDDVEPLIAAAATDEAELGALLARVRPLARGQPTFVKLIGEWRAPLLAHGVEWDSDAGGPQRDRVPAPLLYLIYASSLERLKRKWGLDEARPSQPALAELLALVLDSVLAPDAVCELYLAPAPAWPRLLADMQAHHEASGARAYPRLERELGPLEEIPDLERWLAEAGAAASPAASLPADLLVLIGAGPPPSHPPAAATVPLASAASGDLAAAALALWVRGAPIDLAAFMPAGRHETATLPGYPFQGESFWLDRPEPAAPAPARDAGPRGPRTDWVWSTAGDAIVGDHVIAGRPLVPAALVVDCFLSALSADEPAAPPDLVNVELQRPSIVEGTFAARVAIDRARSRLSFSGSGSGSGSEEVAARAGFAGASAGPAPRPCPGPAGDEIDCAAVYQQLATRGYQYGPSLQVLRRAWAGAAGVLAEIETSQPDDWTGVTSPFLLDGCFQAALLPFVKDAAPRGGSEDAWRLLVPWRIGRLRTLRPLGRRGYVSCPAELTRVSPESVTATLYAYDEHRRLAHAIEDITFLRVARDFARPRAAAPATSAAEDRPAPGGATILQPIWEPANEAPRGRRLAPTTVVVGDEAGWAEALAAGVAAQGGEALIVSDAADGPTARELRDGRGWEALAASLRARAGGAAKGQAAPGEADVALVYPLIGDDRPDRATDLEARLDGGLRALVRLMTAVLRGPKLRLRVVVVTRDLFVTRDGDTGGAFVHGTMVGFARSLRRESPWLQLQVVDVGRDATPSAAAARVLASADSGEVAVACRGETTYLPRFLPVAAAAVPLRLREGAAYVVAGGAGGVGADICRLMARRGRVALALLGRSAPGESQRLLLEELGRMGARTEHVQVDAADPEALAAALAGIRRRLGRIAGVVNSAGVLADGLLVGKPPAAFEAVLRSKVHGTFWLDRLTEDDDLDFFVLFSSVVSLLGNLGQTDYAAANAFLDAFAHARQRRRPEQRTVSINWTLWAAGGMGRDAGTRAQLDRLGLRPLATRDGVAAFEAIVRTGLSQAVVLDGACVELPLARSASPSEPRSAPPTAEEAHPMNPATPPSTIAETEDTIRAVLAEILAVPGASLDADAPFSDLGVDSVTMMEAVTRLEQVFGDRIHHTLLIEHPSIERLSRQLVGAAPTPAPAPAAPPPAVPPALLPTAAAAASGARAPRARPPGGEPIAIIGVSCRLPGSPDPGAFLDNLLEGRSFIREVPADRWSAERYFAPIGVGGDVRKTYSKWAGFLDGLDRFDPELFRMKPEDAADVDPQQRLMLELVEELIRDAGYARADVAGRNLGTFIAVHESDYGRRVPRRPKYCGRNGVVNVLANMVPGRLADFFDLRGPAETVNTACSSSLVAVHGACQRLRAGDCDMAIVGGVELLLDEEWFVGFSQAKALAHDGVCRAFDRRASGFVLGEGAVALLLKPLDRALADGDRVRAVVLGSAVNNDGATMGITTPNLAAQKDVIRTALDRAGVDAGDIGLYEAHGTGTPIGDAIEVKAATETYRGFTDRRGYCALGSVKANIGHLLVAAGATSLLKAVLCLERRRLAPNVNCDEPHPMFNLAESPFTLSRTQRPWDAAAGPRRAAVSAFGFGGTNCHVVVEEAPPTARPARAPLPPPQYKRRRLWLDQSRYDDDPLRALLRAVASGDVSAEQAVRQARAVQAAQVTR